MCTLIVLHRCIAGRPLVVAANRDEFLARPAEDLAIRSSASGPILSPLDLEAGGTWVGLSQRGVFAGLTNLRPLAGTVDPAANGRKLESRGGVVMSALEAASATDAVHGLAASLAEDAYNPFQLLVADARAAYLLVYRGRPRVIELEPGVHIVGNVEDEGIAAALGTAADLDDLEDVASAYPGFAGIENLEGQADQKEPRARKLARIRARVERIVTEPGFDLFEGLAQVCREHVDEQGVESAFEATCVHIAEAEMAAALQSELPVDRYGTRSSLLLELADDPGTSRLWATDGAPCRNAYANRSELLKDLGVA